MITLKLTGNLTKKDQQLENDFKFADKAISFSVKLQSILWSPESGTRGSKLVITLLGKGGSAI